MVEVEQRIVRETKSSMETQEGRKGVGVSPHLRRIWLDLRPTLLKLRPTSLELRGTLLHLVWAILPGSAAKREYPHRHRRHAQASDAAAARLKSHLKSRRRTASSLPR